MMIFLFKPYLILLLFFHCSVADDNGFNFVYKNSDDSQLTGVRQVQTDGQMVRTNETLDSGVGHTFYVRPFRFKNSSTGDAFSFSTQFVFGMIPKDPQFAFHGMTFAITPSTAVIEASSSQHLGLFNRTTDGNESNHIVALELDSFRNIELGDIDSNHIGLDINSIVSVFATTVGYYDPNGAFKNLTLASSQEIRAWIDYDGVTKHLNVTLAPIHMRKPEKPLASVQKDLSPILLQDMYVGFTSATGVLVQTFYVVAWSFQINGKAQDIDLSKLPSLPIKKKSTRHKKMILAFGFCLGGLIVIAAVSIWAFVLYRRRKRKFAEVLEGWEVQYGPHRFAYKDLYTATKGFKESELLGKGGFGQVYKGVLPNIETPVAVKKIWHESGQGMKEFVAEIATIGRLRHPNLVRLLGYCRRQGELFLVYDYMPNLSLDNLLFDSKSGIILTWNQRVKIVLDVAEALTYLHEEWVEVIIHRDIKASNVLLDADLNAKLGDFGLARFGNNGTEAQTTHLAGTLGYIAPELARKGKATTATDIFAFGAFILEVVCGRRPVQVRGRNEVAILVDLVLDCWFKEELLNVVDPKLGDDYDRDELGLFLKVGLLCSHSCPSVRPSMSQVLKFLKGEESLPTDFDSVLEIREDYSGRLGDGSSSAYFSQIQYNTASAPITVSFTSSGR
ncbi:L-type lectin-domain containing receptor kinase V.9-like isoform X1 [Rutidosis leptorrhynchoides]|uniref:L-type lectin-domain containing receptor kinase V.9-like isoform X1 n=1 Tax=Rutidosis leptorrhynchoides TaxID=125765 RepID=UPI003A997176